MSDIFVVVVNEGPGYVVIANTRNGRHRSCNEGTSNREARIQGYLRILQSTYNNEEYEWLECSGGGGALLVHITLGLN